MIAMVNPNVILPPIQIDLMISFVPLVNDDFEMLNLSTLWEF
jgi:hypothetical protein